MNSIDPGTMDTIVLAGVIIWLLVCCKVAMFVIDRSFSLISWLKALKTPSEAISGQSGMKTRDGEKAAKKRPKAMVHDIRKDR